MTKDRLQRIGRIYIALVAISAPLIFVFTTPSIHYERTPYIIFWALLDIAADIRLLRIIYHEQMDLTLAFTVQLSAVILLGTPEAVWIVIIATLIVECIEKRTWYKALFNAGQYAISLSVTGMLFHALKLSPDTVRLDILRDLPALLVAVSVYYFLNTLLISIVIAFTTDNRFKDVFSRDFKIITSYFFILTPISMAVALLYKEEQPYIILIMIPPLFMADQAFRWYYNIRWETRETLKVLANTIDERDKYTAFHSSNVALYARNISLRLGLKPVDIDEIEMAAQVHDLGKVGVSDSILNKKAKLSVEEYDQIKKHPVTAYQMLKNLRPYKKGAKYVLHHHERFDGAGYPEGLSGASIPLGARILTVADSFDAMTTDRPYRRRLSQAEAVCELKQCSGTQFDPHIVEAFIEVLKEDYGCKETSSCCKEGE